jgi:hypothetical protein
LTGAAAAGGLASAGENIYAGNAMAKNDSPLAPPRVRRWLNLFYAAPLLCVLGIYGYFLYSRVHHVPSPERVISSPPFFAVAFGGVTANFFADGNQLRSTGSDLFLEFRDARGQLTNVGEVSLELSLHMPQMVMHSLGKVFPTSTSGRYRTTIEPQMGGEWSVHLAFHGPGGNGETNFPLTVK